MEDRWRYGDLANAVASVAELRSLAQAAGVTLNTLYAWRAVTVAYPPADRCPEVPWTVHQVFACQPDRLALLADHRWTVDEARRFVSRRVDAGEHPASKRPRREVVSSAA